MVTETYSAPPEPEEDTKLVSIVADEIECPAVKTREEAPAPTAMAGDSTTPDASTIEESERETVKVYILSLSFRRVFFNMPNEEVQSSTRDTQTK